ncbi:MAG: DUF192 domain-containing protein [Microcystaceae cyanobacterium]
MKRILGSFLLFGLITITIFVQKTLTQDYTPPTVEPLPITAQVQIGTEIIKLEVAATPEQQQQGLMYRTELPKNQGMLFTFSPARVAKFWMKNTLISLDMIFLKDGEVKAVIDNVPPCRRDPCPSYGPSVLVNQVIELQAGQAQILGIEVGDRLEITPLSPTP